MSILKNVVGLVGLLIVSASLLEAKEVNVISDRSDFHIKPILKSYEESTGTKVNYVFVDQGSLAARLESGVDNADVVVTTDLTELAIAKSKGYTQPIQSKKVSDMIKLHTADKDGHYVALSYRVRGIVYNKSKINPNDLNGYEDLSSPKFKGRVCSRPLTHTYNIALISSMLAEKGEAYTRQWVKGVQSNLAMTPTGNDRTQAQFVYEGKCDIAIMNSYYYGLLMSNEKQRPIANGTQIFFPNQKQNGAFAMYSGASLLKTSKNKAEGTKLIEYMLGTVGQNHFAQVNFEYPIDETVSTSVITQGFGEGQNGIVNGKSKIDYVDLNKAAENRNIAVQIVKEL